MINWGVVRMGKERRHCFTAKGTNMPKEKDCLNNAVKTAVHAEKAKIIPCTATRISNCGGVSVLKFSASYFLRWLFF